MESVNVGGVEEEKAESSDGPRQLLEGSQVRYGEGGGEGGGKEFTSESSQHAAVAAGQQER